MLPNPEYMAAMSADASGEQTRLSWYDLFERYYDGVHPAQVPASNKQQLEKYWGFRANICDVIVDALAERLVVTGFNTGDSAIDERCNELWQQNRMDDDAATIHTEAAMLGDSFVVVDWDSERLRPRLNYNPAGMITVRYTDGANRVMAWAAKRWDEPDGKTRRKNVYYPDRIERYVSTVNRLGQYAEAGWSPYSGDGQKAVLDWTDNSGRPLGIPVFHFRNKAKGRPYGRSEIANVIPLQDAINKTLVDLLLVLDTQGWPQRWVRGNEPAGGWKVGPGRVWSSNDPNFSAGELAQAEPSGLLAALTKIINIAAGRSRTPQYLFYIDGSIPSGEALKTADAGLAAKTRDRQRSFGNAWEDALFLALRLDNTFGGQSWPVDDLMIETQWADPELRNDLANAQRISTLAPWLSDAEVLRLAGYSQQKIEIILNERDAEARRKNQLGGTLLDAFRQGDSYDVALPQDANQDGSNIAPAARPGGQAFVRNTDR